MAIILADNLIEKWKYKFYPPVERDSNWYLFKWHICVAGEAVNPILYAKGGEIQVEQFGIIGWLYKVKHADGKYYFYQCPLIESRESGTGKFRIWLENVKNFVRHEYNAPLALANITNEHLYKYCVKCNVPVAVYNRLYTVTIEKQK